MLSAVYYPHTTLHFDSVGAAHRLLKRSLLLWDQLDFIVPAAGFVPQYEDATVAKAVELIGNNRYPTDEEKKQAHEQIEELVTRPNLPEIFFSRGMGDDGFDIYPDKLLPHTWDLLKQSRLAVRPGAMTPGPPAEAGGGGFERGGRYYDNYDAFLSTTGQAGLAVLSILADCCAGTTRSRVTDRYGAYTKLTGLLADKAEETKVRDHMVDVTMQAATRKELLITLKLPLLDVDQLDLAQLVEFRERESAEAGHTLRDLRHRYLNRVEKQVQLATTTAATTSDVEELERQFYEESKDDLAALRQELRSELKQAILSKDVMVTLLAAAGSLAFALFAQQFHVPTVFSLTSLPITALGLESARDKFSRSRSEILRKHPMAFLHELGRR